MPSTLSMYTEIDKYFLQHMLNNGILNYTNAEKLLLLLAEKLNLRAKRLNLVITDINEKIKDHLFRIDSQICEVTGNKMCIFVNTTSDNISQTSSSFTPGELELFHNILSNIMTSDTKSISTITCLNISSRIKNNMTKDFAQSKVDFWSKNGYLVKQDGLIYFGARTISEFDFYLKNQYPERITVCQLCTVPVYHGKICGECSVVLHVHCASRYINKYQKCPICKKQWQEAEGRSYEADENDSAADSS